MNHHHHRISRESMANGRNISTGSQHRRGRSLTGVSKETDLNLDPFFMNRRIFSSALSDESNISMKLGKISVGLEKLGKGGMDDLLSSVDGGKHDYDWLLTPPGTPLFSSLDASESQPTVSAPRSNSHVRSVSTTNPSRLSVTQPENNYSSRPTRSSSVTRTSISTMNYNTYSSNRSSSILNTSSASVTSLSRPSTPGMRSTLPSTTRSSTPAARSVPSRPSTPVKSRPTPTSSSGEKTRASQNTRPSTPTSRSQIPANLNSPTTRSNSRPSTPTRRKPAPDPPLVTSRSGRVITNGRNPAPASRGSSPGPRVRPPAQPIVPPDFPLDTPPNLRTTLPDRPLSAGRSRPSGAVTVRGNSEAPGPLNLSRRHSSSPIVARGRLPELSGRGRLHANGHHVGATENQKIKSFSDPVMRKHAKPATATESIGLGRTSSKKSLEIVNRMDIRHGSSGILPMSGTTRFPQSIRSGTLQGQLAGHGSDALVSVSSNGGPSISSNTTILGNRNCNGRSRTEDDNCYLSAKVCELDIYESSRYDAILLKEDLKNTNWLHDINEKSDQGLIFDHRFEPLPELFDPL